MPTTKFKAVHVGNCWCVMMFEGSEPKQTVASNIASEEMARVIAACLTLNSWSAETLESGRVDIIRVEP